MGKTKQDYSEALDWVRFTLNPEMPMPHISNWREVYDFCDKQKITGVCEPTRFDVHVDEDVLLDWLALFYSLRKNSDILNHRIADLFQILHRDGIPCCLLKGQGNALMYPDPLMRIPGDIDIWIDKDKRELDDYFIQHFPDAKQSFKHLKVWYEGTPVDAHDTPLKLYHPKHNKYLQEWILSQKEEQFAHQAALYGTDTLIPVPTPVFNAVYQMGHIMIHLLDEGVGLRHIIDYYYVLKNLDTITETEKQRIRDVWRKLGMLKLATGIMWIEQEVLEIPRNLLLVSPDEKRGRLLLEDILEGGNFGKGSKRQVLEKKGFLLKGIVLAVHNIKLCSLFPSEIPFKLVGKIKTLINYFSSKN